MRPRCNPFAHSPVSNSPARGAVSLPRTLLRGTHRQQLAARPLGHGAPRSQRRTFFSRSSSSSSSSSAPGGDGAAQGVKIQDGATAFVAAASSRGPPGDDVDASMYPLGRLAKELDRVVGSPRFEIDGAKDVRILRGPEEFYNVLKEKILGAQHRIFLSTLYIGKTEHEFIATIRTALQRNPSLKISFLTDALRGTREAPDPTCASLLAPLIAEFGPERVQIRMYHTPNLTGLRKKLIPQRINEGWGLQHMKLYGIDDEIIMSGANLSNDYFTNRQDRYHVFRSKDLTEYYERIHQAVSSISFDVQPSATEASGFRMSWPSSNGGPSPLDDPKGYIAHAAALLGPLVTPNTQTTGPSAISPRAKTIVYPIFSLPPLLPNPPAPALHRHTPPTATPPGSPQTHYSTELTALTTLLSALPHAPFAPVQLTFTAGYFNPTRPLVALLLATRPASLTVLAASPYANGFYGSKGVSGLLPPAYTLLCKRFLRAVEKQRARGAFALSDAAPAANGAANGTAKADAAAREGAVRLLEWRRGTVGQDGGWTYHAKGIWVTLPPAHADGHVPRHGGKDRQRHVSGQGHVEAQVEAPGEAQGEAQGQGKRDAEHGPSITVVGSSNYTARAYALDLEANALVLTRDAALQAALAREEAWLLRDAAQVTLAGEYARRERRVGVGVRVAMWVTALVGGAL